MTTATNLVSVLAGPAAAHPHRPALVVGDRSFDYGTVDTMARMFAGALAGLGARPGEPVALLLPNVPHFTVAYFGALYGGHPVVPINPLLTADELAYHLELSGATVVVAWETFTAVAAEAAARAPRARSLVIARADLADLSAPEGWHNLVAVVGAATPVDGPFPSRPDDTAVLLFTSGTTGRPKAAELTHANLLYNARAAAGLVSLGSGTVALVALPLFHAFGMTVMHNAVLAVGGSLVLLPRFDAAAALGLIEAHGVTFFGGVPTMYAALLAAAGPDTRLPSLRWCVSGGAAMPAAVMEAFERRFAVAVIEGYGLSETSPVVSFTVPGRPRAPGSVGYPLPGTEVRLVGDDGAEVGEPGVPGEVLVSGPGVMRGYLGDPAATAESCPDGWLRTGDIGTWDGDGALHLVDRKKDIVIRGGFNVYPAEVERVLHEHPAVAQAAVVGVPDERLGEDVRAVVVLRPGAAVTGPELAGFCRARLASYKRPRTVEVWDSLPLGPTGKVLKTEVRRRRQEQGAA
ncbi:MAG: AMP-binding protein [Actinomycetota bacterium]